jgi:DNA-binding IclR family transcriptional regulator
VLDKAVAILHELEAGPRSLADLARATRLPRATAHRLAAALERHLLVGRDEAGRFVLGPGLVRLGRLANGSTRRSLVDAALPVLAMLRDQTGESAQLYVRSGDTRVCLASLESPHSLRTIVAVGAVLPVDRGSAGKVLAAGGAGAAPRWAESVEERERGVASVSAPVVVDGCVIAAVSVSGPVERTTRHPGRRYAAAVTEAARLLAEALGEVRSVGGGAAAAGYPPGGPDGAGAGYPPAGASPANLGTFGDFGYAFSDFRPPNEPKAQNVPND